ncbi:MAG TPA: hypothetical protein V6D23_03030 [Candidatus Obscuribacterales bacterium]
MPIIKRLSLSLLTAGCIGLAGQAVAAAPLQLAQTNQTLTGRQDYDTHPGPGDTDINNDGKNDMEQIQQKLGPIGDKIEQKLGPVGDKLEDGTKKAGKWAEQQVDKLSNQLPDPNDIEVKQDLWGNWMIIGLIALVLLAVIIGVARRRRTVYYNGY